MANPYYGVTGNPVTLSRGTSGLMRAEFGLIEVGFDAANVQILLRGLIAGQTWTGTHIFPATTSIGDVSAAEIAYLDGVTGSIQTQIDDKQTQINGKGAIAGQVWTGTQNFTGATVSVPTATAGDSSPSVASTAFVADLVSSTAFSSALPGQAGHEGEFVTTDGVNASWGDAPAGSTVFTALNFGAL